MSGITTSPLYRSCAEYWDGYLEDKELLEFVQALYFNLDGLRVEDTIDAIKSGIWNNCTLTWEDFHVIPVFAEKNWRA